jgi:hypothetical protein
MSELRLTHKVDRMMIDLWATDPKLECVYAVSSCWWSLFDDEWMPYRNGQLPCDPRGSMLMQHSLREFWTKALAADTHYGKHGIEALVAAFQSNVEVKIADGRWLPTSLASWDAYNELLDREAMKAIEP